VVANLRPSIKSQEGGKELKVGRGEIERGSDPRQDRQALKLGRKDGRT